MEDKYFVFKPELTPYEGVKVTKETNLKFENERIKQEIKDLKLKSTYTVKTEKFTSTTKLELNLDEGEILLLEQENRGYFLPSNIGVCSIDEAIRDYNVLKEVLEGNKDDSTGNEKESSKAN